MSMLERGFFRHKKQAKPKPSRFISMASGIMLSLGVMILIAALIYLLVNIDKVDAIFITWTVFMLAGLFLVVMSNLIKWLFK